MDLDQLQKHRMKLYQQSLKKQYEEQLQYKRYINNQIKQQEYEDMIKTVQRVKEEDYRNNYQRRRMASDVAEMNLRMDAYKKQSSRIAQHQNPQSKNGIISTLLNDDVNRQVSLKQKQAFQAQANKTFLNQKKHIDYLNKSVDKQQQNKHVNTILQQRKRSVQDYQDLKRKHSQNMNFYNLQKRISDEEDKYKQSLIRKFEDKQQIFAYVKRNQQEQRKKQALYLQEEIKRQMDQFNEKRKNEKIEYKVPDDLEKSMLSSVLLRGPQDHSFLSQELKKQMSERKSREKQEHKQRRQKVAIDNIFGGKPTRQREFQLNFIDSKLGIRFQKPFPSSHVKPQTNLNTYQQARARYKRNPQQLRKMSQSQQQINQQYIQPNLSQYSNKKSQQNFLSNKVKETMSKSIQVDNLKTQQSFVKNQQLPKPSSKQSSQGQKGQYLSFDLITGKNRYYQKIN